MNRLSLSKHVNLSTLTAILEIIRIGQIFKRTHYPNLNQPGGSMQTIGKPVAAPQLTSKHIVGSVSVHLLLLAAIPAFGCRL